MIVAEARRWLGTPFRHQASLRGVGCDCVGLVRGVWREVIGPEPFEMPPYSNDWGEVAGIEVVNDMLGRAFTADAPQEAGVVVLFRVQRGRVARHVGIMTGEDTVIMAVERHGVGEWPMRGEWRRRIASLWGWPEGGF